MSDKNDALGMMYGVEDILTHVHVNKFAYVYKRIKGSVQSLDQLGQ